MLYGNYPRRDPTEISNMLMQQAQHQESVPQKLLLLSTVINFGDSIVESFSIY